MTDPIPKPRDPFAAEAQNSMPPIRLKPAPCDWTEDFEHENGNYESRCMSCGIAFTGHKRRVICKICASRITEPAKSETQEQWERKMMGETIRAEFKEDERVASLERRLREVEKERDERTDNLVEWAKRFVAVKHQRDAALAEVEKLRTEKAGWAHSSESWELLHAKRHEELEVAQAELSSLRASLADAVRERDEAREKREHTQQWYAQRWERLKDWARHEIPDELREQFFSIVANGQAAIGEEPPSIAIQLNLMRHERDAALAQLAEAKSNP